MSIKRWFGKLFLSRQESVPRAADSRAAARAADSRAADSVVRNPKAADALYEQAARLMLEEQNDLALFNMHAALFQDPRHLKATCGVGSLSIKLKDYKKAEDYFRKALEIDSSSAMARVWLGQSLAGQGNYHDALKLYAEVVTGGSELFPALFSSALAYADLRDWDSALVAVDSALEIDPNMPLAKRAKQFILSRKEIRYNS
jgi:tetratricopeptide (TPR) repeat protein